MPKQSYHRPYTVKYIIISTTIKKNNKKNNKWNKTVQKISYIKQIQNKRK